MFKRRVENIAKIRHVGNWVKYFSRSTIVGNFYFSR